MFVPTTLALLPPGIMLLNRSTVSRDSATDIKKTSRKGAPERERPNRSVVIIRRCQVKFLESYRNLKKILRKIYGTGLKIVGKF